MPYTTKRSLTVVDGEIVSERLDASGAISDRDYVPDSLGSTVRLVDSTGTMTDTFDYWPYGELRSHTGTYSTPFLFVGTKGYYNDTEDRTYIRARHYRQDLGRWMSVDPLWPEEKPYEYAGNNPVTHIDPTGQSWRPLTTTDLRCLARGIGLITNNNAIGAAFEGCYEDASGLTKNSGWARFRSPWRRARHGRNETVPDFVSAIVAPRRIFHASVFHEIKAVSSRTLTPNSNRGQIGGMLDWLSSRSVAARRKWIPPHLLFATTSDTRLHPDVFTSALHPNKYNLTGYTPPRYMVIAMQFKAEFNPCVRPGDDNIRWRVQAQPIGIAGYISCRLRRSSVTVSTAPVEGGSPPGPHCNYKCSCPSAR